MGTDRDTLVRDINRTVARLAYRLVIAADHQSDAAVAEHAATSPTIETDVRVLGKETKIHWRHCFGPRPKLSPFIDTPQKAARLEARLAFVRAAQGEDRAKDGARPSKAQLDRF